MKFKSLTIILFMLVMSTSFSQTNDIKPDSLKITIGRTILNHTNWKQNYRLTDKSLKTISIYISVFKGSKANDEVDFNLFSLVDETKNLRIRPVAMFNFRREKRKYASISPLNENYNDFPKFSMKGFKDFEIPTYKVNFLGVKKKNTNPTLKTLKRVTIGNKKITYFVDFPVPEGFTYAKLYYKNRPVGFAAIKE